MGKNGEKRRLQQVISNIAAKIKDAEDHHLDMEVSLALLQEARDMGAAHGDILTDLLVEALDEHIQQCKNRNNLIMEMTRFIHSLKPSDLEDWLSKLATLSVHSFECGRRLSELEIQCRDIKRAWAGAAAQRSQNIARQTRAQAAESRAEAARAELNRRLRDNPKKSKDELLHEMASETTADGKPKYGKYSTLKKNCQQIKRAKNVQA